MNKQEILEGNRLIAEFEYGTNDWKILKDKYGITGKRLNYNHNWIWLMPVVEKIESMGHKVNIIDKSCSILFDHEFQFGNTCDTKIEAVYASVIEFIKHYNKTKP